MLQARLYVCIKRELLVRPTANFSHIPPLPSRYAPKPLHPPLTPLHLIRVHPLISPLSTLAALYTVYYCHHLTFIPAPSACRRILFMLINITWYINSLSRIFRLWSNTLQSYHGLGWWLRFGVEQTVPISPCRLLKLCIVVLQHRQSRFGPWLWPYARLSCSLLPPLFPFPDAKTENRHQTINSSFTPPNMISRALLCYIYIHNINRILNMISFMLLFYLTCISLA